MALRTLIHALPLVAVALAPLPSAAKPTPKKSQANTSASPQHVGKVAPLTKQGKTRVLPRKHLNAVKKARPLDKAAKQALLKKRGLNVPTNEIGKPTKVTVRKPWANAATHLAFTGLNMVFPGENNAVIGQVSDATAYDDAEKPDEGAAEPAFSLPRCWGPACGLAPVGLPPGAPKRGANYVTLRFKASKNKDYLVDCIASGDANLNAQVIDAKKIASTTTAAADGHFSLRVESGKRRHVRIDMFSAKPWSLRQCSITPVG